MAAGVRAQMITVDLNHPSVKLTAQLASGFPGCAETFESMVKRSRPAAAVNGTYFCKKTLKPVGDIVIAGEERNFGGMGTAMAITADNRVVFRRVEWGRHQDWSEYETVLAAGPTLLTGGQVDARPQEEGFTDPHVLGAGSRTAAGLTSDRRLLLVCVPSAVTLTRLASVMKALGCADAMALDGGASVAMYYRGRVIQSPGRKLTNLVLVYEGARGEQLAYVSRPQQRPALLGQSAWARYERGRDELDEGRPEAAVEHLKAAADLEPGNASYHLALADAYSRLGMETERSNALARAGRCYSDKQLHHDALVQYETALAANPRNLEARRGLADAYAALGMAEQASEQAQKAENTAFEIASTAPGAAAALVTRLAGEVADGKYVERNVGFELPVPPGWQLIPADSPMAVKMRSTSKPYVAVLHVVSLAGPVDLRAYEELFATENFKHKLAARKVTLSGRKGYEVLYEEFVMDRSVGSRYLFTATDRWLFILACSTYAEYYEEARQDFQSIVDGLRVTQ